MINAPLALAFSAGMVATVNPCGFAMLPAYVSYFVGIEDDKPTSAPQRAQRALVTASVVSAGFLVVFGIVGTIVTLGLRQIVDYVPWVSIGIGVVLVALGIAMLTGFSLKVALPHIDKGGHSRRTRSVFLFGISYAVASLSCTLPVFLAVVSGTVTRENFASGFAAFVAYAAGMSVILFTLTIAVSVANHSIVGLLRRASQFVDRAAGVLLIIAGSYIVYYWTWFQVADVGTTSGYGPIGFVEGLSTSATRFIFDHQDSIVAIFVLSVGAAVTLMLSARARQPQDRAKPSPDRRSPDEHSIEAEPPHRRVR